MDVQGLRCLVTGAASGIGDAVARRLVAGGARVMSLDRNTPTAEVEQHVAVDLAEPASIDTALGRIDGTFDVLANVAGIPGTLPGELVFAVNFLGMRHLTEAAIPRLRSGGSIVVVGSTAGRQWALRADALREVIATSSFAAGLAWFRAHPQEGNAYNFSKEAASFYVLARGAALHRQSGVRMNAVLPGPVETPILRAFEESMGKEALDAVKSLAGRHATVEDIAPVVTFLASRDSRWVNGTTLIADGGTIMTGLVPAPRIGRPGEVPSILRGGRATTSAAPADRADGVGS